MSSNCTQSFGFARSAHLVALGAAIALLPAAGWSDIIYLKDGSNVKGSIDKKTQNGANVTIHTTAGDISMPKTKIDRVEQEDEATNHLRIANQHLALKKWPEAAAEFTQALQINPNLTEAATGLKTAQGEIQKLQEAQQKASGQSAKEAIANGVKLTEEGKLEEAVAVLRAVNIAAAPELKGEYDKALASCSYKLGLKFLDHQDPSRAAAMLDYSLKIDPTNTDARNKLLTIWGTDTSQVDKVVAALKDSTKPEDQVKLADAYIKQKKYEDALKIYVKYASDPKLIPPSTLDRMHNAFQVVHVEYATKGDYEKAMIAYEYFLQLFPNESPVPLARYDCLLKASKMNLNDPDQLAEMAEYGEQRGFLEPAKKAYIKVLSMKPNQPVALAGLRRAAEASLQDLMAFYNDGQYALAAAEAYQISKDYVLLPDVVKQAQDMQARGQEALAQQAASTQQQAVALAKRGDDYYAQAQGYLSALVNTQVNSNQRAFSPKSEAAKYYRQAQFAYQQALSLDPSLGDPMSYDLNRKISDAASMYAQLSSTTPPRVRYENPTQ